MDQEDPKDLHRKESNSTNDYSHKPNSELYETCHALTH